MFEGSIPALVTPMRDGTIDEEAFRGFVDWQIQEGSRGVVPVGTTGESPTLSHAEHRRVVEICIEAVGGRVPVIAGAGSNNTAEAIELARHAESAGADAVLVVTPYYNKPSQRGLYAHFRAVAEAITIPLIIYNIPPRSVIDMSVETMTQLFRDCENIVGVKDATANLARPSLQRLAMGPDFIQLSGEDATALGLHGARRTRLHFRDGECRAEALRGIPGRLPLRRLPDRSRLSGPPDAASSRALPRAEPGAREIRALAAREDA